MTAPDRTRRRFLATFGATAVGGTSGCLGWVRDDEREEPPGGWYTDESYTTAEATETFARRTGTRTPYPGVKQIYAGEGTLVLACFDYAHEPSIRWWREEFPKLSDLLEEGAFRPTLLMFPLPTNAWSVMVPSAVFEVRARGTREEAWRFHELLVDRAPEYSFDLLRELADEVGVDGDAVVEAAETRRRRNQTFSDRQLGRDSGVETLPAFRWGTDPIEGRSAAELREFIEDRR